MHSIFNKSGKRILVAKKRVTHSVPQAPQVDGKVSTCPREIYKVHINIIREVIVASNLVDNRYTSSGAEYLHNDAAISSGFP